ncbi:prepilin peptidase [Endothiovibrio diazotrophicus]
MIDTALRLPGLYLPAALLFGLVVGSFLNVVILRLPPRMEWEWRSQCREFMGLEGEAEEPPPGLVFDRSRCPKCGHAIRPWENVPLISWLLLRGRCSGCGAPISLQYPLVEGVSGLLALAVVWHFGPTWQGLAMLVLCWGLLAASVIDLRTQLLPDDIVLPLLWLGLALSLGGLFVSAEQAILGAMAGYLSLWSVYQLFKLLTGKEGMGYGDFKLLAVIGAWGGWQLLPVVILLSSLVGAVVGVGLMVLRRHDRNVPIPFGPYIAAAGLIGLLWGDRLIAAYWRLAF